MPYAVHATQLQSKCIHVQQLQMQHGIADTPCSLGTCCQGPRLVALLQAVDFSGSLDLSCQSLETEEVDHRDVPEPFESFPYKDSSHGTLCRGTLSWSKE